MYQHIAEEKKELMRKIQEYRYYFNELVEKIRRRQNEKDKNVSIFEGLEKESPEYKLVFERNIELQNQVIIILRALFFIHEPSRQKFSKKLKEILKPENMLK